MTARRYHGGRIENGLNFRLIFRDRCGDSFKYNRLTKVASSVFIVRRVWSRFMLRLDDSIDNDAENPAATRCREEATSRCRNFHFSVFPSCRSRDLFFFFFPSAALVVVGASQVAANHVLLPRVGSRNHTTVAKKKKKAGGSERRKRERTSC